MKKFTKRKPIVITLGMIFAISTLTNANFNNYLNSKGNNEHKLKRTGFWEIGPIEIDDDDPSKNWLITAATYDWCSGSGTINNPYVIENVMINLGGAEGNCIEILNSNVHFIIKNSFLSNTSYSAAYYAGINLDNVNNGKILNNSIMHVSSGVYFWRSDSITIYDNQISETIFCMRGFGNFLNITKNYVQIGELRLTSSSNCVIENNILQDSQISLDQYCDNNLILNNFINTTYESIRDSIILIRSKNSTIKDNNLTGGGVYLDGVYEEIVSHTIDKSNLVNNKPIYYYKKVSGLTSKNFTYPGQIILADCNNSIISDMFISKCGSSSILSYFCKNITFSNNLLIENPHHGFHLIDCIDITIRNNTLSKNLYGVALYGCNFSNIIKNDISENRWKDYDGRGIYLLECNFNKIIQNQIHKNRDIGIDLEGSKNCTILHNYISNSMGDGILLSRYQPSNTYSNFNFIYKNTIFNNSRTGVEIHGGNNNLLYMNNFVENKINAEDQGNNNRWDNGSIGNYWDDYEGQDLNGDGIGDTPYDVPPAGGSADNYPIITFIDLLPPNIIINSPSMNDVFGLNTPDFNITINDQSPINTTWYTIDGGLTNFTFSGLTGTINQTAWDNKGPELMTLRFYANDSLGHIGFKDVLIWKDLVAPKITITSPTPNQLCGIAAPTFDLQITEPNLQEKRYSLNGRPNITFTTETQFNQAEWNQVGNGTVSIIFYAIDKVGNTNSSEVIVRKDAYVPDIIIYSPLDDQKFGKTSPEYNITIIEEDLVSTWYTIEGIAGTFLFTGLRGTINQDAWNDVPEGEIAITFYAQDRAGNLGSESVVVIKSIPSEPAIPGYNLFFLPGVLSVLVILIRKKLKKS